MNPFVRRPWMVKLADPVRRPHPLTSPFSTPDLGTPGGRDGPVRLSRLESWMRGDCSVRTRRVDRRESTEKFGRVLPTPLVCALGVDRRMEVRPFVPHPTLVFRPPKGRREIHLRSRHGSSGTPITHPLFLRNSQRPRVDGRVRPLSGRGPNNKTGLYPGKIPSFRPLFKREGGRKGILDLST